MPFSLDKGPGLTCPACSKVIPWTELRFSSSDPFPCPFCGWGVSLVRSHSAWMGFLQLLFTLGIVHGLGMRGWDLLWGALLGFFPVGLALAFLRIRLLPPRLRMSDDYMSHVRSSTQPSSESPREHGQSDFDTSQR